jgi:hypothetical protein
MNECGQSDQKEMMNIYRARGKYDELTAELYDLIGFREWTQQ